MKVSFTSALFFLLTLFSASAAAQELLDDTELKTKEEFVASEAKVINTINWLETTPADQQAEKRKLVMARLLKWVTNSPTVTIGINMELLPFTKKNAELLIIFIGGWTKYSLQNNYSEDELKCNLAGIRSAMKVYKMGNGLKKDKEMDKLIELEEKNGLEAWVKEQIAKAKK